MTRGASRDQSIERDEAPCGNIPVAVRRVEWRPAGVGSRVAGAGASGSFAVRLRSALSHDSGQGRRACLLCTSSTSESDCHLRAVPQSRAVRCGGQRAHARGQLLTIVDIAELQVDAAAASGYCCCSWRSELPSCSHGGFTSWAAAWARETATWRGRHAPSSKGACSGRSAGARGRGGTSDGRYWLC